MDKVLILLMLTLSGCSEKPIETQEVNEGIPENILPAPLGNSVADNLPPDKFSHITKEEVLSYIHLYSITKGESVEEILEISTKFISDKENVDNLEQLRLVLMGEGSKIIANRYKQDISITNDIDLFDETAFDICESGLKLIEGQNKQEVVIIPKRPKKKGFFEKLFHLFK